MTRETATLGRIPLRRIEQRPAFGVHCALGDDEQPEVRKGWPAPKRMEEAR